MKTEEIHSTKLVADLEIPEPPGEQEPVIKARGLTRRFGRHVAVRDFDLDVYRGEVFGFLGPNGAGKSTAIRMMVGLLTPSAGSLEVLGHELPREVEKLRPKLGYMTQRFSLYEDLSVEENLDFTAEIFGLDRKNRALRVAKTLREYGLMERREQRPATLSGGWKQRLALAAATIHQPELLFLDEPTAGVDPDSRRLFWEKLFEIAETGTTILVSTHYMDEAVRCHRLCLIRRGEQAALGRPSEMTDALDDRVLELTAPDLPRAIAVVRRSRGVQSVTQLGYRVHVLLEEADAEESGPRLLWELAEAGLVADIEIAEPNLEDVFVAVTHAESFKPPGS